MNSVRHGVVLYMLLVALIFTVNVKGQYQPTVTYSKEWLVKTCEFGNCLYDYYYFVADTSINGLSYKVLDGYHYNKNFYLREDAQQRKVYILINDGSPFPKEYLLYDYSMQVGDSVYVQNPVSPVSSIEGYYYLDSIIPETFEQITRKVFYLHGWDAQNTYHETKWIEGIGSTGLINAPGVMGDTSAMAELLCVSENVQKIYSRKSNDTCYSNPALEVGEVLVATSHNSFYYAQYSQVLLFESLERPAVLTIVDMNGRVVLERKVAVQTESVRLQDLNPGIYLVNLRIGRKEEVKKILVK